MIVFLILIKIKNIFKLCSSSYLIPLLCAMVYYIILFSLNIYMRRMQISGIKKTFFTNVLTTNKFLSDFLHTSKVL
jgi:hypothetical protein